MPWHLIKASSIMAEALRPGYVTGYGSEFVSILFRRDYTVLPNKQLSSRQSIVKRPFFFRSSFFLSSSYPLVSEFFTSRLAVRYYVSSVSNVHDNPTVTYLPTIGVMSSSARSQQASAEQVGLLEKLNILPTLAYCCSCSCFVRL